ncbi:hypothetical protein [Streptomyces sp. NPDC096311]|uniref:hypothetical protein n=1 Tax=Streptomyces sp. NPDC096311 TaxID=3366083 RepID=UPI0037F9340A
MPEVFNSLLLSRSWWPSGAAPRSTGVGLAGGRVVYTLGHVLGALFGEDGKNAGERLLQRFRVGA